MLLIACNFPGSPDTPTNLQVYNITSTSAIITWTSGFNGGATQTFHLNLNGNDVANTEDLGRGMMIRYQFMELESTTGYTVSVFSRNGAGTSEYMNIITFTTLDQEMGMY